MAHHKMTFSFMTHSIMTHRIMTQSLMTLSIMTLSLMAQSLTTLIMMMTLDAEVLLYCLTLLSDIMPSVIMLSDVTLSVGHPQRACVV